MKKIILSLAVLACVVTGILADTPVRVFHSIPKGTNAVVAVKFGTGTVVPTAYDIAGLTATNGTCAVFVVRNINGEPVTNTLVAAAACASTNTVTVSDFRSYLYNERLVFQFSDSLGGQLWVYGTEKK